MPQCPRAPHHAALLAALPALPRPGGRPAPRQHHGQAPHHPGRGQRGLGQEQLPGDHELRGRGGGVPGAGGPLAQRGRRQPLREDDQGAAEVDGHLPAVLHQHQVQQEAEARVWQCCVQDSADARGPEVGVPHRDDREEPLQ